MKSQKYVLYRLAYHLHIARYGHIARNGLYAEKISTKCKVIISYVKKKLFLHREMLIKWNCFKLGK